MVEPSLVDSIHSINQDTKADLPIPRPDATANLNISGKSLTWFLCMCVEISLKIFSCHFLGPEKCSRGVLGSPHGKMNLTKFNGSSFIFIDQTEVINSFSCSGLYFIKKIISTVYIYTHYAGCSRGGNSWKDQKLATLELARVRLHTEGRR